MAVTIRAKQYNVVLVGHGKMGEAYADAVRRHPRLQTVAVVGRSIESTKAFRANHGIELGFSSVDAAYATTLAHVVIIAVPTDQTAQVLEDARTKPWKCLTEKPAGRNLKESKKLLDGLHSSPWPVSVAMNRRFYPHIREIRKEILGSKGGVYLQARDQHKLGVEESLSADVLFRKAIHMVDLFHYFSRGEVESCSSRLIRLADVGRVIEAKIDFSCRTRINYVSVINAPGRWELSLHSDKSSWKLDPLEQGWRVPEFPSEIVPLDNAQDISGSKPGVIQVLNALVHELDTGFSDLPSLAESHKSMALLSEIFSPLGWKK